VLHEGETTDSQDLTFSHLKQQQQEQEQEQLLPLQGSRFIYHPLDDDSSKNDDNEWRRKRRMTNSREEVTERDTMMVVQYREAGEREKEEMMSKMGERESDRKTWEEEMALFSSKNDEGLASCEEAILDEVQPLIYMNYMREWKGVVWGFP
jgi:hypothetical protein